MVEIGVESENGWRPATSAPDDPLLVWKTVPGTSPEVTIQVMRGLPEVFLPAWAADWNANIEAVRDADTASYTPTNSVATSNHLNGTAEDIDWDNHPFQVVGTVTDAQRATIADMLTFYEGWIYWAGNWDSPVDEMHSQMGYNTWNRNTAALDFIARKIRSDGLSTYQRGPLAGDPVPATPATPAAPPPDPTTHDSAIQALYDAVPVIDMPTATTLVDAVIAGLALAQCDTPLRIAMYLAQTGHESDGYATTVEYGDLSGEAFYPYIGRTWIQITWESNYAAFGAWCVQQKLIADPNQFVNDPVSLGDLNWAGIGAAWYWTAARPTINSLADQGDIVSVTQLINGGQNGIQDRTDRYNQALALGDRLLLLLPPVAPVSPPPAPPTTGGFLMALTDDEQAELLAKTRDVWDQLRGPGGAGWSQLGQDADGNNLTPVDALAVTKGAVLALHAGAVNVGISNAIKGVPPK